MAFLVALLTFFSTLFGGYLALKFKDKLHLVLAFASGAVIATALFELLPEIINQSLVTNIPMTNFLVFSAVGFLLFHSLEKIFVFEKIADQGHLAASGFSIHSFFDGLGIGMAFFSSFELGILVSIAVLAHDFSDGLNTTTVILKNKGNTTTAIKWLFIVAITPMLGVFSSVILHSYILILPYALSFYFGFFLYLGASDLLPEAHHRHSSYPTLIATILGFIFIYGVSGILKSLT